jgi:cell division protein FtsB
MRFKMIWRRPLLTLTQLIVLLFVIAALVIVLDLNRRAKEGRVVGVGEEDLRAELAEETTRQVELQATLTYVQGDDYVAVYAREEGGYLLPGEKRIVPLLLEKEPLPTPVAVPTADPAQNVHPWQAWWQLLTDAPAPSQSGRTE